MITWLGEDDCHEVGRVGGKAANLSRLSAIHRVPSGFVLTPRFAAATLRDGERRHAQTVANAYFQLCGILSLDDAPVAVRSSAVDEDGGEASFAGQHGTLLNVRGAPSVMRAVLHCVASSTSSGALAYRQRIGLSADGVRMAVLVQALIPSDVSAVVFSANPVTGNRNEVLINASWGLGESIVSGAVNPDTFVVEKSTLRVLVSTPGDKTEMTVVAGEGTRQVAVPPRLRTTLSLTTEQAVEATRLALTLERTMGWPVDVECGFHNGQLHLLQCRPITTLR